MTGGAGITRGAVFLTHAMIEGSVPEPQPYRITDTRTAGLAIRIAPSGLKTWDLAFRIGGTSKVRRLSLGQFPSVGLKTARDRANELTAAARLGKDLQAVEREAARAEAARVTVSGLIDLYVRKRVTGQLRTAKEIESRLKRCLKPMLDRFAADIRRRDIRELLERAADEGITREAEKRRQTVGAMFRWALSQDIVEIDPTAGLTAYDPGTPRDRALSVEEIQRLWGWLDSSDLPGEAIDILRLQLALGARCSEIGGMCVEEIDQQAWLWTLPASRSKDGRAHVTPLLGVARQIVERRLEVVSAGPLFLTSTGRPLNSSHIGHYLLHRAGKLPIEKFRTHDLRRTVATRMSDVGIALDVIAIVVGHNSGSKDTRILVKHYIRTDMVDRKRMALAQWNDRLVNIVNGVGNNVVMLKTA